MNPWGTLVIFHPVSLILLHWWMATPTQMPVLLQLSLMGSAAAEKQSQISSGSFQFAAIREMFFIAGWAAASQLLGEQCLWSTSGSALSSWKTSWEKKQNKTKQWLWITMISVVCPKTTKRCNLPHFLAPFPQNYSKDPLILKSYQAAFGKNPSPTHLSSEGKAGHPALMGQVSLRLMAKGGDSVLKVIKSAKLVKFSLLMTAVISESPQPNKWRCRPQPKAGS